jgi:DNA-binding transcriptional LysR family regulator
LEICVIPALSRVMASHPKVTLNLLEGRWREFVQLLLTGQIDIAVLEASVLINDHRLTVQPLPRHRTCFYCRAGHPLAARRSVSIRDLAAFPLIAVPLARSIMPNESIQAFRQTIEPATGDIMSPVTVTSLTAMREIVQRSDGIGFSVSSQIVQDVKVGSLVVLRTSFELPSTGYGVAWLKDRKLSWIAEAFVQTLHHVEVDVARGKVGSVQQRRKSRRHRQARA